MKIINAWICRITGNSVLPIFGDIIIEDGIIKKIKEKHFSIKEIFRITDDKTGVLNAKAKVITIPLINFHDHLYSRLAKGLPLSGSMDNFHNILKNLWWKVDRALDIDMITASAQLGLLESVKNGTTYIFDHHSSPDSAKGSLKLIADAINEIGLSAVLCFETTDRNGAVSANEGINENKSLFQNYSNKNIKGLLGLHASFTVSDKTLSEASLLVKKYNTGIHIHLCEDKIDREISEKNYNASPVERLVKFDLINEKSILSHGIYLNEDDYEKIANYGSAVALNLDSNMNNSVGLPDFKIIPDEIPILMGTDGMHSSSAKSLKQIFLLYRHMGKSFDESFRFIQKIYFDQIKFVKRFFPDFTGLNSGDLADMVIWDYIPLTPFTKDNFWGHFIYGILESRISDVVKNGKFLMKDFSLLIDEDDYIINIHKEGNRLFNKFKETN